MGLAMCLGSGARADDSDIQKQLSNPIASLTLLPVQVNYDTNIGPNRDGDRVTTNIQPVVPIKLDSEWTMVVRTILPVIGQDDIFPGSGSQFGLGDTLQSFFFVPQTVNGFTWGAGPAILWRTGTDELLTSGKWAAGPTAVALQQTGPWTVGALVNHVWSFAGDDNRADVSTTFIQPFVAYAASGGWTYTLNTESSYDWVGDQWSVPINAMITKLTKIGDQPVSIQGGLRYWAESPDSGPHDFGGRFAVTFIFP
ncbi:MAG: transporter [Hyphomicrobiaceae bacterium]|nr:transporter [Hyphomicrobiaceae bacterium]